MMRSMRRSVMRWSISFIRKCDLYRTSGYHLLYGEAGLYNFDEYIGRTAAVCFRIICCKAALCDYRCRMLQGASEW